MITSLLLLYLLTNFLSSFFHSSLLFLHSCPCWFPCCVLFITLNTFHYKYFHLFLFFFTGLNNRALIKVSGLLPPGAVTKVQLLDLQGLVFQEIAFIPRPDDQYTFDWVNFNAPSGLFYIRIVGVDLNGNVFHRCSPTAISAILPGKLNTTYHWY